MWKNNPIKNNRNDTQEEWVIDLSLFDDWTSYKNVFEIVRRRKSRFILLDWWCWLLEWMTWCDVMSVCVTLRDCVTSATACYDHVLVMQLITTQKRYSERGFVNLGTLIVSLKCFRNTAHFHFFSFFSLFHCFTKCLKNTTNKCSKFSLFFSLFSVFYPCWFRILL